MVILSNIGWAAGFYEGEGSFHKHYVSITQKDRWPLEHLVKLFGGEISEYNGYFYWRIYGAKCRGFVLTIFTFLSPRRRRQIIEYPLFFKDPKFLSNQVCQNGHPYVEGSYQIIESRGKQVKQCLFCQVRKNLRNGRTSLPTMLKLAEFIEKRDKVG